MYQLDSDDAVVSQALTVLRKRLHEQDLRPQLKNDADVGRYLKLATHDKPVEELHLLCLNSEGHLIDDHVFPGSSDSMLTFDIRDAVRIALNHNASHVVLAHNHPASDIGPSETDMTATIKLTAALSLVGVRLIDHLVITNSRIDSVLDATNAKIDKLEQMQKVIADMPQELQRMHKLKGMDPEALGLKGSTVIDGDDLPEELKLALLGAILGGKKKDPKDLN